MKKIKTKFIHIHKYFLFVPCIIIIFGIFYSPNTAYFAYITEKSIIAATNRERVKNNLPQLVPNKKLHLAAKNKAKDIFIHQKFAHNISKQKFSEWIKNQGYDYTFVGENLAIDFVTNQGIINAWLKSPSHRNNLLNSNFEEIGIAVQEGIFEGEKTTLVVQIFGKPADSKNVYHSNTNYNNQEKNSLFLKEKEQQNIYLILKNKIKPYNNILNLQNLKISIYTLSIYLIIYLTEGLLLTRLLIPLFYLSKILSETK